MTNASFFNIITKTKNAGWKPMKPYYRWKQMKPVKNLLTSNMPILMTSFLALSTVGVWFFNYLELVVILDLNNMKNKEYVIT